VSLHDAADDESRLRRRVLRVSRVHACCSRADHFARRLWPMNQNRERSHRSYRSAPKRKAHPFLFYFFFCFFFLTFPRRQAHLSSMRSRKAARAIDISAFWHFSVFFFFTYFFSFPFSFSFPFLGVSGRVRNCFAVKITTTGLRLMLCCVSFDSEKPASTLSRLFALSTLATRETFNVGG